MKIPFVSFPVVVLLLLLMIPSVWSNGRETACEITSGIILEYDFCEIGSLACPAPIWQMHGTAYINHSEGRCGIMRRIGNDTGSFNAWGSWNAPGIKQQDKVNHSASSASIFCVDRNDSVLILSFDAFSDIATSQQNLVYAEVAFLESYPGVAGHPHYGHDLSFEAVQMFSSNSRHPTHLRANVENQEHISHGIRYSHFPEEPVNGSQINMTAYLKDRLARPFNNLVIWRPQAEHDRTSVEQWGENMFAEYSIPSAMRSHFSNDGGYARFDEVRVTLNRGLHGLSTYFESTLRKDRHILEADLGITSLAVAITRKTDPTLDMRVDAADAAQAMSSMDSCKNCSFFDGDADDDGDVDLHDLQLIDRDFGWQGGAAPAAHSKLKQYVMTPWGSKSGHVTDSAPLQMNLEFYPWKNELILTLPATNASYRALRIMSDTFNTTSANSELLSAKYISRRVRDQFYTDILLRNGAITNRSADHEVVLKASGMDEAPILSVARSLQLYYIDDTGLSLHQSNITFHMRSPLISCLVVAAKPPLLSKHVADDKHAICPQQYCPAYIYAFSIIA